MKRRLTCRLCTKKFSNPGNLNKHITAHVEARRRDEKRASC